MYVRMKEEDKILDERLQVMPFVRADYGKMPSYAIFRVSEQKCKTMKSIKSFEWHMARKHEVPNADSERTVNNEQIYGAKDLYEDTVNYLKDVKLRSNSVIGRTLLLTASPQFFKGMLKQDFNKWIQLNIEWMKETFGDSFRAAYVHLDENSPHIHSILICKMWNDRSKCYTLQNYRFFNGYKALRELQDSYANKMQDTFPVLQRGCVGSRSKHIKMSKLYGIMNNTENESLENLQAKAANNELLKMKLNYMDKTLKSFQYVNRKKDEKNEKLEEENKKLQKQIEELKSNIGTNTLEENKTKQKSLKRGFSGKRYKGIG